MTSSVQGYEDLRKVLELACTLVAGQGISRPDVGAGDRVGGFIIPKSISGMYAELAAVQAVRGVVNSVPSLLSERDGLREALKEIAAGDFYDRPVQKRHDFEILTVREQVMEIARLALSNSGGE